MAYNKYIWHILNVHNTCITKTYDFMINDIERVSDVIIQIMTDGEGHIQCHLTSAIQGGSEKGSEPL